MKISKVKIENFRSLQNVEFSTTDFNILVGQNNCGKTNFFEAIEFFFNGVGRGGSIVELKYKRDPEVDISVEIEFSGALLGAASMQNPSNRTKIQTALNGFDNVSFRRSSLDINKRTMVVNGQEVNPGTGFDKALNDFLPKLEYINTKQYYDAVAKFSKTTPIGIMLSGVLSAILERNQQYLDFQMKFNELFESDASEIKIQFDSIGSSVKGYLEKQFPDTTKVKFEVTPPAFEDLLKNFSTSIDDGVETSAEEKGDGMQRALMLAIIQAYAEFRRANDDIGKSFLFLIDEAELHLHPTAQRKLKNVLHSLSLESDQVFINTHSSVFVADNLAQQSLFRAEKIEGITEIYPVDENDKPYVVFELLGGSPADILMPQNFIVVEGLSEYELLSRVIKRFYTDRPNIQILKANGDIDQAERTINAIEKAFTPLSASIYKNKTVLLLDMPSDQKKGGFDQFLNNNTHLTANGQVYTLSRRDIEQCYPDRPCTIYGNWQKTQDECDRMNGRKKKQLAKYVGDNITQDEFESALQTGFEALKKSWELAFEI